MQTALQFADETAPPAVKLPTKGTGEAYRYLCHRLVEHAKRGGVQLRGSAGDRGFPSYHPTVESNVYLLDEPTVRELNAASGQELRTGKAACVWSSSALCVSAWAPYRDNPSIPLKALRLPAAGSKTLCLEKQYPIFSFGSPPNLDVAITYNDGSILAIESKLGEPWSGRGKIGVQIKNKYRGLSMIWDEWPSLRRFIDGPCPHEFLDSHQLVKHLIGLRHTNRTFSLLYLFMDVPGRESGFHREEIDHFTSVCREDGIELKTRTYQNLFMGLPDGDHKNWLLSRYG